MPEQANTPQICPFLGLAADRESRFSFPETTHRCFSSSPETQIPIEHQAAFCFRAEHQTCSRFNGSTIELVIPEAAPVLGTATAEESAIFSPGRLILWGLAAILALTTIYYYASTLLERVNEAEEAVTDVPVVAEATLTATSTPESTQPAVVDDTGQLTPEPLAISAAPVPTLTPIPDGEILEISPEAAAVGWVASGEDRGNHFGDSYLYAGIFEGQVYQSVFQIDLSAVPRGAPIDYAALHLTGLRDDRLGRDGVWTLRMLAPEIDLDWSGRNYQDVFNAATLQTLSPILGRQDLEKGKTNVFEFSPAQIRILEERIVDNEEPVISFRLDGPLIGTDNLFAWDTGYGPQTQESKVVLVLNVGPPPATPPLYDFVVVTSTPTPENVVTAAALVAQATAEATRIGTATPPPPNMVTATPFPEYLVIVDTPVPENGATAQAIMAEATAIAVTTGTATPFPTNAVTATPTGTPTQTSTPLPPPTYVVVTSTPTPDSIYAAATLSAAATAQARTLGPATPVPDNWATPIVVTATPLPLNSATAEAESILATAIALTTGTPTPTPNNVQTATPTPAFNLIEPILQPTVTPIASPRPVAMPSELIGKILFLSNREASDEEGNPQVYVFDPATKQLGRLTARWPYDLAVARDAWSADQRFRIFTKDAIRYKKIEPTIGDPIFEREDIPALYWSDSLYKAEEQLTHFGAGIAFEGAWSPTNEQIVFVSNDSADDDIWTVNRDGSGLKQLTDDNRAFNAREIGKDTFIPEVNRRPSFSPDGQQIVFFSTRTGNHQLWVMNRDGSEQQILMDWTPYNDWDPVWVKYSDLPPILPPTDQ